MENIIFELKGVNGQIFVYEDRVIIERKGVLGFMTQGLAGSKTIPIKSIQSIQFKKGNMLTNGFIQFGILGGHEKTGGLFNATQDENTVMIKERDNLLGEQIKAHIENYIFDKPKDSINSNNISVADEIKKLKELFDLGIITEEEFQHKKKQLLGL